MTLAATIATAPLIAHDFERLSLASIPANLLVLPAVAPVMWIGMLIGLLAQVPGLPAVPLGLVEGPLIDWIALVARVLGSPGWAEAEVGGGGPIAIGAGYLGASAAVAVALATLRRRRAAGGRTGGASIRGDGGPGGARARAGRRRIRLPAGDRAASG